MKIRTWQERLDDGTDAITTSADVKFAMGDEIEELREALVELQGKLDSLAMSHSIWLDKTDWVQVTSLPPELGMHRADVLKLRINDLTERLHKTGERLKLANARIKEILVSNGFKTYEDYNNDLRSCVRHWTSQNLPMHELIPLSSLCQKHGAGDNLHGPLRKKYEANHDKNKRC